MEDEAIPLAVVGRVTVGVDQSEAGVEQRAAVEGQRVDLKEKLVK